jgi:uncharacterized protein
MGATLTPRTLQHESQRPKITQGRLGPKGLEFTEDAIADALATRALFEMLRQSGEFGSGPAPFTRSDRSRFLSKLGETIHAIRHDLRG